MTQVVVAPDHAERALDHEVLPQRTLRNLQVAAVPGHCVVIGHDPLLLQPQLFRNTSCSVRNMRSDRPLASGEWAPMCLTPSRFKGQVRACKSKWLPRSV
jgi:hypothetical protein